MKIGGRTSSADICGEEERWLGQNRRNVNACFKKIIGRFDSAPFQHEEKRRNTEKSMNRALKLQNNIESMPLCTCFVPCYSEVVFIVPPCEPFSFRAPNVDPKNTSPKQIPRYSVAALLNDAAQH